MILSADCRHQLTKTGTDPVQLGPISRHAQIISIIGLTAVMCAPSSYKKFNISDLNKNSRKQKEKLAALRASVGFKKINTVFQQHVNKYQPTTKTRRFVVPNFNNLHLFDTDSLMTIVSDEK